ncbi:dynein regulatory complex protein 10 [Prorops nasuta]|uniref:dynein regulatory complex protein 10 n=1 Tax=Prorops nasuta TaxID=863751 RepID=UPI0034CFEBB1
MTSNKKLRRNFDKCICKPEEFQEPIFSLERRTSSVISRPEFSCELPANERTRIIESIINVFERTIKNLEFAATVPLIINDSKLSRILNEHQMLLIRSGTFSILKEAASSEDTVESCKNNESYITISEIDHGVFEALKTLKSYSAIREISREHRENFSAPVFLFLKQMKSFFEHVISRMCTKPEEIRAEELKYQKLLLINKEANTDIKKLKKKLEDQKTAHKESMRDWIFESRRDMLTIQGINKRCRDTIKDIIMKFEWKQHSLHKSSEIRQNDLRLGVTNAKAELDSIKEANERMEKSQRVGRKKLEIELLTLIKKFDTDIGERQEMLNELLQIYEDNEKEAASLKDLYYHLKMFQYTTGIETEREDVFLAGATKAFESLTTLQRKTECDLDNCTRDIKV